MQRLLQQSGFIPLILVAFMNAFVDLGHKVVIQNTAFKVFDGGTQIALTGLVNALILLPFIALMTPAGFIADRFAKPKVMRLGALAAIAITLGITACYYLGWFWLGLALTVVLAAQSAIYGPAKLGYLKELTAVEDLATANGVIQAATTSAILAGMLAFSFGFEYLLDATTVRQPSAILQTIAPLGWFLVAGSIVEYLLARRLPDTRTDTPELRFDFARYRRGEYLKATLGDVWRQPVLRLSMIGLAVFWSIAQALIAIYPTFAENFLHMDNVATIQLVMAAASIGVVIGSILAASLTRAHIETGFVPIGALGVAACLSLMSIAPSPALQMLLFFGLGIFGALFIVPLNALIQFNANADDIGRVLAASSLISNVSMIVFLGITILFALRGYDDSALLAILTLVAVAGAIYTVYKLPQSMVRLLIGRLFAVRYRLSVAGLEHVPRSGGVLLLGNHISWIDWAIVAMASPRPVRFVMARGIYEKWYLRWFLDFVGVIPIGSGSSQDSIHEIGQRLALGEVVCLFPEGTISRHGQLNAFKRGFEHAAAAAGYDNLVIVPFYLRGLWGSQFSHSSGALKSRMRGGRRRDIVVAFGAPLAADCAAVAVKQAVAELSVTAWEHYVESLPTLARAWLATVKRRGSDTAIIESSGRKLTRAGFAAVVLCFARQIKQRSRGTTVAIALPPGIAGAAVNIAALLCGKTIVNLNYSASGPALAAAVAQAGIVQVYTSSQFLERLRQRDIDLAASLAHCELIELEALRAKVKSWHLALAWLVLRALPSNFIARLYRAETDPTRAAVILFSSGSEGQPKGVVLSHRNVTANVKQITDMLNPVDDDVIVGCLPLFHAFGLTVTTLLPLIEGLPLVTHPDPTDVVGIAKAIYRHRGTMLCATSTFLRLYVRNARVLPAMLESLRLVVAGAERLDNAVRDGFAQKFAKTIYEGYGATETTPVASVNVPDYLDSDTWKMHSGNKHATVGMPLPGSCFRVVDPDSLALLPVGDDGLILIGGVQVMQGYLNAPERTRAAIVELDGRRWYRTGDKGHLDSDGFLTIVDRYSRFAKIGGEMLSLSAIETAIARLVDEPEFELIVVNLADAKKGERLIALVPSTCAILSNLSALKARIKASGLNPLSVPSDWLGVDAMPKLGSGKADFAAAREMAIAAFAD